MDFLTYPILNLAAAQCFILLLAKHGLMHHFDDGAVDTLQHNGIVTAKEATLIDQRVNELYRFNWGPYNCPIGFALTHEYDLLPTEIKHG